MCFGSATNLSKLSFLEKLIKIVPDTISPSAVVRDLESSLTPNSTWSCTSVESRVRASTSCVVCGLFAANSARLVSFVLSRLDYCNALLAELPASSLAPLQQVMNAAARLVCDLSSRDHVTSALQSLHYLNKQRIVFKLCLYVHLTINGKAPTYLK